MSAVIPCGRDTITLTRGEERLQSDDITFVEDDAGSEIKIEIKANGNTATFIVDLETAHKIETSIYFLRVAG